MSATLDSLFGLSGKVAIITDNGGLSSIDVAPMLASVGATVVVADSDAASGDKIVDGIDPSGKSACFVQTDIESEESVDALFAEVKRRFGRCDILVNCAGLTANEPFPESTMAHYDAMQSVNQRSIFMLMRAGVRLMLEAGAGGRIVNITTIGSLQPVLKGNAGYGATRAAVTSMTRAVAYDHATDGILANLVLPGAVSGKTRFHPDLLTRLSAGGKMAGAATTEGRLPLGMGAGNDIAAAVLYLVGPAGRYITGQSLVLDGGFLLT